MKEYVAEVLPQLTADERRAIGELDGHYGRGPAHISSCLNVSLTRARWILRELRRHGICDYGWLGSEDDGLLQGRGYWLGRFGEAVRDQIEIEEREQCS